MSTPKVEIYELYRYAQNLGCDFVFYDRFVQVCAKYGISPSRAAIEAGLSKSTVSKWKNTPDAEPTGAALKKLSDYFGISIADLLSEENKKAPTVSGERSVSDDEIKFALFGGDGEITDAMYEEVRRFAAFVKQREADKKKE